MIDNEKDITISESEMLYAAKHIVKMIQINKNEKTPSFFHWNELANILPFFLFPLDGKTEITILLINELLDKVKIAKNDKPFYFLNNKKPARFYQFDEDELIDLCNLIYQAGRNNESLASPNHLTKGTLQ